MQQTSPAVRLQAITESYDTVEVGLSTVDVDKADEHLSRTRGKRQRPKKDHFDQMITTYQE